MSKFASGKNSYAISDRSGFRYRYKDMRKEWNGLLGPFRKVIDPEALQNARPDRIEPLVVSVGTPTVQQPNNRPLSAFGQVGYVTVVIT